MVDLIVRLRKEPADAGLDAGSETIAWHLEHHHGHRVSRSTLSRHLTAGGLVIPAERFQQTMKKWLRAQPVGTGVRRFR